MAHRTIKNRPAVFHLHYQRQLGLRYYLQFLHCAKVLIMEWNFKLHIPNQRCNINFKAHNLNWKLRFEDVNLEFLQSYNWSPKYRIFPYLILQYLSLNACMLSHSSKTIGTLVLVISTSMWPCPNYRMKHLIWPIS